MPGTREAPTVSGIPTLTEISLGLIDASGDLYSESLTKAGAVADGDIEDWAAAYQPATQASLWRVSVTDHYIGDKDASNAITDIRFAVENGVNLLFKNPAIADGHGGRLVAPITTLMQGNQDIPLLSTAPFPALITAYLALLTGYNLNSAQYTTRRERKNNPRIVT